MKKTLGSLRPLAPLLLAVGLLLLGYALYAIVDTEVFNQREQQQFEPHTGKKDGVVEPALPAPPVADGESIASIEIARLGLKAVVIQGDSDVNLRRGVGHLAETALPGEVGNVVLAGHRDTVFRPLKDVRAGDAITLTTRDGEFAYRVESMSVVPPTAIDVLEPTGGRTLTLITCYPFYFVGAAPNRFIVRARQSS